MSPSDVQLEPSMQKSYEKPVPMSRKDIKDLIEKFVGCRGTGQSWS